MRHLLPARPEAEAAMIDRIDEGTIRRRRTGGWRLRSRDNRAADRDRIDGANWTMAARTSVRWQRR